MGDCFSQDKDKTGADGGKHEHVGNAGVKVDSKVVMGRYHMHMGKEDVMGEGTSSICRRGTDTSSGKSVAIKVYKSTKQGGVTLLKFKRQIEVLQQLQEPFQQPSDPNLWHAKLAETAPRDLFMTLLDFSKDARGVPAADAKDGVLYVVTEIAQYSMKDYLALRRSKKNPLSPSSVRNLAEAILLVMAGLHAKGLVHIDFKPENVMMFDGKLKLIDVDGCVKMGSKVSITDSSISFSPCYCAPEWAKFLIDESNSTITVSPALDVWSVGMTLCELVTLDAVLKPMYASFLRSSNRSSEEAGFLFMEWLSSAKKAPTPSSIKKHDAEFAKVINELLCEPNQRVRKSCAQALSHPYFSTPSGKDSTGLSMIEAPDDVTVRNIRRRSADEEHAVVFKCMLWKLNTKANPMDAGAWLQRDMWVTPNGNLCYFSQKENKRLVLLDAQKMHNCELTKLSTGTARENAFVLKTHLDGHDELAQDIDMYFAADSAQELDQWMQQLAKASEICAIKTMRLGNKYAEDLQKYRVNIKNRRMKVESGEGFESAFKSKLWKVKGEGDRMKPEDWFEREFTMARNGSLVYWSKREERDLIYYTAADVAASTVTAIPNDNSAKPWGFSIALPEKDSVEFAPGEMAADSEETRQQWFDQFSAHGATVRNEVA